MAQIVAGGVTASLVEGSRYSGPSLTRNWMVFNISFGDGTATYTNGGVPLTKAKLGCPETLQQFIMMDTGSSVGYVAKFDKTALTLRLYQSTNTTAAGTASLVEMSTAAAVSATTVQALVMGW